MLKLKFKRNRVIKENCLAIKRPDLAKQWHPTKNGKWTPKDFSLWSREEVWWKCQMGHEWPGTIFNRSHNGGKCPYCIGLFVCPENSLFNTNKTIAKQWHLTKNLPLTPHDVTSGSRKIIFWECVNCGRIWHSRVCNRTQKGASLCNKCSKKSKKATRKNSLLSKRPMLAKDWHPTKNDNLFPENITYCSKKIVWWKCHKCGYEWEEKIANRLNASCCKKCRSLCYKRPEIFKELSLTKNKIKNIYDVEFGSQKIFYWKCSLCDHEFKETVASRCKRKSNKCRHCSSLGCNNIELSKEFDFKNNGGKTPFNYYSKSHAKVAWKCSICNHKWKSTIGSRNKGVGCPKCSKNVLLKDGTKCDSLVEALFYLKYKKNKNKFLYNDFYPNFGQHRYDFYFPDENKYVEITSYDKSYKRIKKYMKTILKKKNFVEKN